MNTSSILLLTISKYFLIFHDLKITEIKFHFKNSLANQFFSIPMKKSKLVNNLLALIPEKGIRLPNLGHSFKRKYKINFYNACPYMKSLLQFIRSCRQFFFEGGLVYAINPKRKSSKCNAAANKPDITNKGRRYSTQEIHVVDNPFTPSTHTVRVKFKHKLLMKFLFFLLGF